MNAVVLKQKIKKFSKSKNTITIMTFFVLGALMMLFPSLQAHADDLFAGGKEQIKDSFGKGSTVVYVLYLIEIIAAIYTYARTKNLGVFVGIAVVMIFVNVVFGLI
ncbi:type IV conjugative transfer system pilin TraA [Xenorhabdus ishibashii]|uniref:Pilin n=1 Tax=Xenorhabdus ishibashii TaxID=1034471 RepID=A0A2D0K865_9GAMM|nr:Pilin [Xenorhabdus ishibashii]